MREYATTQMTGRPRIRLVHALPSPHIREAIALAVRRATGAMRSLDTLNTICREREPGVYDAELREAACAIADCARALDAMMAGEQPNPTS